VALDALVTLDIQPEPEYTTNMSTSAKKLFIDFLQNHNACEPGLAWARKQRTGRDILAKLERRDWLVWLVHAVGGPARAEYQRVEGPALAEYYRVVDLAWDEYKRVEGPAWAEYKRVRDLAEAEYKRVADLARAEYKRVKGPAAKKALTWKRVLKAIQKKRN